MTPGMTNSDTSFCRGDVDVMGYLSDGLAIPEGYPPPTHLPADFHSQVKVREIIDSEYPGYVYLVLSYLLQESTDDGKYKATQYDRSWIQIYAGYDFFDSMRDQIHGPALRLPLYMTCPWSCAVDLVLCARCLSWPPQAADWPKRHRNYGWPDSATIHRVVGSGCDVVPVAHRQCREDEWMSKHQYRLSFSRAEIILLNSWMPVQQIVYHMLRVFMKIEEFTKMTDNTATRILSNYEVKTLTLWVCELRPKTWWTNDLNVIKICSKLLHILADWLKNKSCPHYFVSNCNLLCTSLHLEITTSRLMSITESWLSTWFVNNYLRKCAESCPEYVSRLFDDVSTNTKLQNTVSAVVDWRTKTLLLDLFVVCSLAEFKLANISSEFTLTVQMCVYFINELVQIDSCLLVYFTAVVFLHVARRIVTHF